MREASHTPATPKVNRDLLSDLFKITPRRRGDAADSFGVHCGFGRPAGLAFGPVVTWGINRNTNDFQILVSSDILQEGGSIASKLLHDTLI